MQEQSILFLAKPKAPVCGMWEAGGLEPGAAGMCPWYGGCRKAAWLDHSPAWRDVLGEWGSPASSGLANTLLGNMPGWGCALHIGVSVLLEKKSGTFSGGFNEVSIHIVSFLPQQDTAQSELPPSQWFGLFPQPQVTLEAPVLLSAAWGALCAPWHCHGRPTRASNTSQIPLCPSQASCRHFQRPKRACAASAIF